MLGNFQVRTAVHNEKFEGSSDFEMIVIKSILYKFFSKTKQVFN